jgi:hypothetical protein
MNYIILVGSGWDEEDLKRPRLVLQRLYNGSVYIMGKRGAMFLPVKDRVEKQTDEIPYGWKEIPNDARNL